MGLTGAEWALLGGSVGGNAIGSLFAPDGQEIQSFADNPNVEIDPGVLMDQLKEMLVNFRDPLWNRINRGNELPGAIVQQPPVFDGGGMPMPIGLSSFDPALFNSDLLSSRARWTDGPAGGDGGTPIGGPGGPGDGGNLPPRNGDDPSGGVSNPPGWYRGSDPKLPTRFPWEPGDPPVQLPRRSRGVPMSGASSIVAGSGASGASGSGGGYY